MAERLLVIDDEPNMLDCSKPFSWIRLVIR